MGRACPMLSRNLNYFYPGYFPSFALKYAAKMNKSSELTFDQEGMKLGWLIGIIIIIVLVHFLIIRPLIERNRPQIIEPRRSIYNGDAYEPHPEQTGWNEGGNSGIGRFGMFAGGMATGALLTYLLEQGRIGLDQFEHFQNLDGNDLLQELEEQNILQQDEIDHLEDSLRNFEDSGHDAHDNGDNGDNGQQGTGFDLANFTSNDDNDFGGWDSGSDDNNWL